MRKEKGFGIAKSPFAFFHLRSLTMIYWDLIFVIGFRCVRSFYVHV